MWLREDGDARLIADIAPPLSGPDSGAYLRPALNDQKDTLAPLAIWFATLFALSMVARYHPVGRRVAAAGLRGEKGDQYRLPIRS